MRPLVEIEFRPDGRLDEELFGSSPLREASMNEFKVDDRPRLPKGPLPDDAECPERAEVVESLRRRGFLLEAFGDASFTDDCVGDGSGDT